MNNLRKKSSFSPAFVFFGAEKRQALDAVYAFCRAVDDAVDDPHGMEPRALLDFWRQEIERVYNSKPQHNIGWDLLFAVRRFGLKKEHFLSLIEGVEMDLSGKKYRTFAELEEYMYKVASVPGLLCMEVAELKNTPPDYAKYAGFAVQLTNIIRDIKEDADNGRIYFPLEDLERFNLSENDILSCAQKEKIIKLLESAYWRAKGFYAKSRALADKKEKIKSLPCSALIAVYEELLEKIRKRRFAVFGNKIKLNSFEKLSAMRRVL